MVADPGHVVVVGPASPLERADPGGGAAVVRPLERLAAEAQEVLHAAARVLDRGAGLEGEAPRTAPRDPVASRRRTACAPAAPPAVKVTRPAAGTRTYSRPRPSRTETVPGPGATTVTTCRGRTTAEGRSSSRRRLEATASGRGRHEDDGEGQGGAGGASRFKIQDLTPFRRHSGAGASRCRAPGAVVTWPWVRRNGAPSLRYGPLSSIPPRSRARPRRGSGRGPGALLRPHRVRAGQGPRHRLRHELEPHRPPPPAGDDGLGGRPLRLRQRRPPRRVPDQRGEDDRASTRRTPSSGTASTATWGTSSSRT